MDPLYVIAGIVITAMDLRLGEPLLTQSVEDLAGAMIAGLAQEPSHGDEPPTPTAIRAILAVALGVDAHELRSLSAASAQSALDRLNELVRRLSERAATDELTGVLRRGAGYAAAQGEIDRTRRAGGRLLLAVVDVDGLKKTNDECGHLAGDNVLRMVATVLMAGLRSYDIIIRFGGDEFLCVLAGLSRSQAAARFRMLSRTLNRQLPGQRISHGFAELGAGDTLDDLISRADAELYKGRRRRGTHSRQSNPTS